MAAQVHICVYGFKDKIVGDKKGTDKKGTDKMVTIESSINQAIQLPLTI